MFPANDLKNPKDMPEAIREELDSQSTINDKMQADDNNSSQDSDADDPKNKMDTLVKSCNGCKLTIIKEDYVKVSSIHLYHPQCFTCDGENCSKRLDKTEFYSLWPETRTLLQVGTLVSTQHPKIDVVAR